MSNLYFAYGALGLMLIVFVAGAFYIRKIQWGLHEHKTIKQKPDDGYGAALSETEVAEVDEAVICLHCNRNLDCDSVGYPQLQPCPYKFEV